MTHTSPAEQGRRPSIDQAALVRLAQRMIQIPSPCLHEAQLARYLAAYLDATGLETQLVPLKTAVGDTEQIIARWPGSGGGHSLMLCGHLDTANWDSDVYRRDLWTVDPYAGTVHEGKLWGNGSINMKSQIAAAIAAVAAVKAAGIRLAGDVVIAGVAAETTGGFGAAQLMASGLRTDFAVVVEPSDFQAVNTFTIASRGRIRFEGRVKHAGVKTTAVDPIQLAHRLLDRFGPQHERIDPNGWLKYEPDPDFPDYPQFRVISLQSVADFCDLIYDVRILPTQTDDDVAEAVQHALQTLEAQDPQFKATLITPPGPNYFRRPQTPAVPRDAEIVQAVRRSHEAILGHTLELGPTARWGFADDSAQLRAAGIQAITYGPGLEEPWPMIDEAIKIEDLTRAAEIYALLMMDVCGVAN